MKRRLIALALSAGLAFSAAACEGEVDTNVDENLEEGVEGEIGEGEGD